MKPEEIKKIITDANLEQDKRRDAQLNNKFGELSDKIDEVRLDIFNEGVRSGLAHAKPSNATQNELSKIKETCIMRGGDIQGIRSAVEANTKQLSELYDLFTSAKAVGRFSKWGLWFLVSIAAGITAWMTIKEHVKAFFR